MIFKILIKASAVKELKKLPVHINNKIDDAIINLSHNPTPKGYKKLQGNHSNLYRIRVSDYRIIYTIENSILTIEIIKIGHRKNIYK